MIRIGIVGCGRILNSHLRGFQSLRAKGVGDFRITALVARREEDAWRFHTRGQGPPQIPPAFGLPATDPLGAPPTYVSDFQDDVSVKVYTDYRQLIDDRAADAILDLTPVFLHHQVALTALEAGLHVLTQKPLAITVRAAHRMVERAALAKRILGTFEDVHYKPLYRAVRWAFTSGMLGRPQMALMGSVGGPWSPNRIVAGTGWRHDKLLAGGGGSIDIGVHQMHLLRYVLGEVRQVQALVRTFEGERIWSDETGRITQQVSANVDDTYFAGVTFEHDVIAQLLWSWAGRGEGIALAGTPAFFGTRGCIKGGEYILDNGTRGDLLDRFEHKCNADERAKAFPLELRDPCAILQLDWLRAIASGGTMETSGHEGLHDLAAAYAILESGIAERAVSLSEVLSGAVDAYQRPIDRHYGLAP